MIRSAKRVSSPRGENPNDALSTEPLQKSWSTRTTCLVLSCFVWGLAGCEPTAPPKFRFNAVEQRKQEKLQLSGGATFSDDYRQQVGTLTLALFGTPEAPKFPFLLGDEDPARELISLENLQRAAGAVASDESGNHRGLYREHCAHCHGITGDGAAPTALPLDPYPRDFRLGKFKFKSTPLRSPPTDADFIRVLQHGIPGTAMPSFRALPDEDIQALVDYVIYLTIRGEFERRLIAEMGSMNGEPFFEIPEGFDPEATDAEVPEKLQEQLFATVGEMLVDEIIPRWLDRDENVTEIESPPIAFDYQSEAFQALAEQGKLLFGGKANCVQCHGVTGLGDGLTGNYDDWTNDWAKTPGVDLTLPETYREFVDLGALPPRPIRPRNLHFPIYRGGSTPEDLFLKVKNGIEGTPMPSSPALTAAEVWAVVAFLKSLPFADPSK